MIHRSAKVDRGAKVFMDLGLVKLCERRLSGWSLIETTGL